MSDDDLRETVEQLASRVNEMEERVEELEAENDQLRETIEEEREQREQAERIARAATAHASRLWEEVEMMDETMGNNFEGVHNRISAALEGASDAGDRATNAALEGADDAELPIQQLARMPEEMAETHLNNENHRNTFRARFVWRDLTDYATRTPAGLVLTSPECQRVLAAGLDAGTIETNTVKRVFDRIVEFTHGVAEKKKRNGNWTLVVPKDWRERAEELDATSDGAVIPQGG